MTAADSAEPDVLAHVYDESLTARAPRAPGRGRRLRGTRPGVLIAAAHLALLVVAAIAPGLLAPHNPLVIGSAPPFLRPFAPGQYLLGTDQDGRDMLSRMIYAVRPSLEMGLGATAIGVAGGATLGLAAGLGARLTESLIMRVIDVVLSIPDLLLALVVIAILGTGTIDALLAVGIASIPSYARMVRAQTHVVRRAAYVEAATAMGVRRLTVIWQHLLPNAIKPVFVLATIGIGTAIGYGASLSFLGLGTKPPAAEWGSMNPVHQQRLAHCGHPRHCRDTHRALRHRRRA
jgi:peptide/nickel transport system permease protein